MVEDGGSPKLGASIRGTLTRGRSAFQTRTATDNAEQLTRRFSTSFPGLAQASSIPRDARRKNVPGVAPTHEGSARPSWLPLFPRRLFRGWIDGAAESLDYGSSPTYRQRSRSAHRHHADDVPNHEPSSTTPLLGDKSQKKSTLPRSGSVPRIVGGSTKLGTFSGVFVPTSLNVLSILMFIRFGFILGQAGLLGMIGLLLVAYAINLATTLSLSAIASNGVVRNGGAYYLISRSLGPEFGGSIGIVFYLGFVFNTGMNVVAVVDCILQNFGSEAGDWARVLPEGGLALEYMYATIVLLLCTSLCLAGSSIFSRLSNGLLALLLISTLSIPFSAIFRGPLTNHETGVEFTGLSLNTLKENLFPHFTKRAAGSQFEGRESFQTLFGILFPACSGIFAGASMSGDLQSPSKSIPKGTIYSLGLTFLLYTSVSVSLAASITRTSFYNSVDVIQDTNISQILIFLGELSTTLFSALMGVIGPAKLLQALSRDNLLPGIAWLGQGTKVDDEPTYAIIMTFIVAQITILFDLNRLASFITMTYLMTFFSTNFACFLLKISSAPNFRPSFKFFSPYTAAAGALASAFAMFFTDGLYAAGCIGILVVLFALIHIGSPPKPWGDVSQALIYHQVRKYLLRLRQEHVKFWRPQILLLVNDPRRGYKTISFCNSLKKGALFILGHVIVASDFGDAVPEARRQQAAWTKLIDFSKIKAFVNIAIAQEAKWGIRNIVLNAGLGGMRPNIVVLGMYNMEAYRMTQSFPDVAELPDTWDLKAIYHDRQAHNLRKRNSDGATGSQLPNESYRSEGLLSMQSYVTVLEDLLLKLHTSVAVAKGFSSLELPDPDGNNKRRFIDLYPIQMSAEVGGEGLRQNVQTTNFDTYTMILQLGCILNTVPSWRKAFTLRVIVFVEYESDVDEERSRVMTLLENLRIQAEVLVFWLASGDVGSYQIIVNGSNDDAHGGITDRVETALGDEEWWYDIKKFRGSVTDPENDAADGIAEAEILLNNVKAWPSSSFQQGHNGDMSGLRGLNKLITHAKRRRSMSSLSGTDLAMGMRTHHLHDDMLDLHNASASEDSDFSDSDYETFSRTVSEDGHSAIVSSDEESESAMDISSLKWSRTPSPASQKSKQSLKGSKGTSKKKQRSLHRAAAVKSVSSSAVTSPRLRPATSDPTLSLPKQPEANNLPDEEAGVRDRSERTGNPPHEATQDEEPPPGPSVIFAKTPVPRRLESDPKAPPQQSIYNRKTSMQSLRASGFPSAASTPLSFNDLPCRAQHLILNELMLINSKLTAVIFTTLPAPIEGTHKIEADCLSYLSDLELLLDGLPPTLLVHSNSMTVTTSL